MQVQPKRGEPLPQVGQELFGITKMLEPGREVISERTMIMSPRACRLLHCRALSLPKTSSALVSADHVVVARSDDPRIVKEVPELKRVDDQITRSTGPATSSPAWSSSASPAASSSWTTRCRRRIRGHTSADANVGASWPPR
jgi:hypothetical protein